MLKIKNQEIQLFEQQIGQNKITIQALEDENLKIKQSISSSSINNIDASIEYERKNSGNLRILSKNSSRNSLKRGSGNLILMTEENDQQSEKMK